MGVLKISPRTSRNGNLFESRHDTAIVDVTGRVESSKEDSGDDSGESELSEVGCEHNMSQGQLFNIPYELYDLPDLRGILSLETWNNCLTEEDRFVLAAYLPDIDQEAFCLTMKELLGGNDIFFDSPLETFFRNLKGGLCDKNVTCYTSGLQFLQRIASSHSLRSYHEKMIKTFSDMKGLWDACDSSTTVKERIHIWKAKNNHSDRVLSLDLNAFPEEEVPLSNEAGEKVRTIPFSKSAHLVETKRMPSVLPPPASSVMKSIPFNTYIKGHLKKKSPGSNEFHACVPNPAPISDLATFRAPPKGVLKMVTKGSGSQKVPSLSSEVSALIDIPVSRTSGPSPLHGWNVRDSNESFSALHTVKGRIYHRSPHLPDHLIHMQGVNYLNDMHQRQYRSPVSISSSQSCSMSEGSSYTIPEGDGSSENATFKSIISSKNLVEGSKALAIGSTRTHKDSDHYRVEQNARSTPEKQFVACADILRGVPQKPESIGQHSGIPKLNAQSAGFVGLPITYKRRKLGTNPLDMTKTPILPDGDHLPESVKTLKIKFRNWNNESFQSQGILNTKPQGT